MAISEFGKCRPCSFIKFTQHPKVIAQVEARSTVIHAPCGGSRTGASQYHLIRGSE